MKVEYYKEYSPCLEREMEYKVYGHAGTPILVFPSQNGRFFDFENNGFAIFGLDVMLFKQTSRKIINNCIFTFTTFVTLSVIFYTQKKYQH